MAFTTDFTLPDTHLNVIVTDILNHFAGVTDANGRVLLHSAERGVEFQASPELDQLPCIREYNDSYEFESRSTYMAGLKATAILRFYLFFAEFQKPDATRNDALDKSRLGLQRERMVYQFVKSLWAPDGGIGSDTDSQECYSQPDYTQPGFGFIPRVDWWNFDSRGGQVYSIVVDHIREVPIGNKVVKLDDNCYCARLAIPVGYMANAVIEE